MKWFFFPSKVFLKCLHSRFEKTIKAYRLTRPVISVAIKSRQRWHLALPLIISASLNAMDVYFFKFSFSFSPLYAKLSLTLLSGNLISDVTGNVSLFIRSYTWFLNFLPHNWLRLKSKNLKSSQSWASNRTIRSDRLLIGHFQDHLLDTIPPTSKFLAKRITK